MFRLMGPRILPPHFGVLRLRLLAGGLTTSEIPSVSMVPAETISVSRNSAVVSAGSVDVAAGPASDLACATGSLVIVIPVIAVASGVADFDSVTYAVETIVLLADHLFCAMVGAVASYLVAPRTCPALLAGLLVALLTWPVYHLTCAPVSPLDAPQTGPGLLAFSLVAPQSWPAPPLV